MSFWGGFEKRASMTQPESMTRNTTSQSKVVNPIKRLAGLSSGQKRVLGAAGVIGGLGLGSIAHSYIKSKERT